jgi:exosome complex component CSL4
MMNDESDEEQQQYTSRTPGEVIGREVDFVAGKGTYSWHHKVVASVVGLQHIIPPSPDAADQRPTVEVRRQEEQGAVPEPGVVVTAKIRKVQPRMAVADVLCVGTRAVRENFRGIVRQQDVRSTEIDKVDMHTSFRSGDIIRAEVLSLGDARAYYLSTAKNELGVVSATSDAGVAMVPINWQEMQCPVTLQKEFRKVAKVC